MISILTKVTTDLCYFELLLEIQIAEYMDQYMVIDVEEVDSISSRQVYQLQQFLLDLIFSDVRKEFLNLPGFLLFNLGHFLQLKEIEYHLYPLFVLRCMSHSQLMQRLIDCDVGFFEFFFF